MEPRAIIAIVGPTAAGKSATALETAALLGNCAIISADSRQLYRYLDIGTAKPTLNERNLFPHYFIDIRNPDEYYSAGIFAEEAGAEIIRQNAAGKRVIVVGGTGLYIASLFNGIFDEPQGDYAEVRIELNSRMASEGRDALHAELAAIDPASAIRYSDKNPRRIMRALEFYYTVGRKFSEYLASKNQTNFNVQYFGITAPQREDLYEKINRRCDKMWAGGLLEETENILQMGYSPELNSLNTVGYKESIDYLTGKMPEAEALEKMRQHTRNYAKRQLTWHRRNQSIKWLFASPVENARFIVDNV